MGKTFSTTLPLPGDTFNALLGKLLQRLGGQPQFGDSDVMVLRRIVQRLTGVNPAPDTDAPTLVALILTALSDCPEAGVSGVDAAQFGGSDGIIYESTALTSTTLSIYLTDIAGMTQANFPNLVSSTNYIDIDSCNELQSVDLSSLETVGDGTFGLYIFGHSNAAFTLIELDNLVTINGEGQFTSNTSMTQFLSPLLVTASGGLRADGCTLLANVSIPEFLPTNGTNVNFADCALIEASVDHVIARCVANAAYVSGTVNVSGGTNATPSATGLANAAILTLRGVTVLTNP